MSDKSHDGRSTNRLGPFQPVGETLRFLTAAAIPGSPPMKETNIARAIAAFPLAGLVIGGLTGDTYGAMSEIGEVVTL